MEVTATSSWDALRKQTPEEIQQGHYGLAVEGAEKNENERIRLQMMLSRIHVLKWMLIVLNDGWNYFEGTRDIALGARKLEAQLDEQMNSYRKLASSKGSTKVDSAENDPESGIDRLLKQLQQVNSQMQAWVSSGGSEMVSHTLTRHQEILQDLTQEFHRLRSGMRAKQEHALLLEDFREFDRTRLDLEDGIGSADQALLREHASISRNTGQMDNVISQAQATLGSLVLQRSTFGGINSKLSNVSSRLPTASSFGAVSFLLP
ncbi:hypothetical protein NC652_000573 [Populus alba x Populus x berolinensis]|nr:hypothetical protein NC652_000573 [Populus alba x Populus x berolinensis]